MIYLVKVYILVAFLVFFAMAGLLSFVAGVALVAGAFRKVPIKVLKEESGQNAYSLRNAKTRHNSPSEYRAA
jgi:hypothetical protein